MSYLSLYRKYRPQRFEDVVGQEPVVRTLQNSLQRGRVAHAYMFSGPRGTGKTSLARLLAKGLNCTQGPTAEPCNTCSNCQRISDGFAMDVTEIDGASNRGIDEIRDLRQNVRSAPTEGGYKVYIIDEVHMLTTDAFNALLKTLEEPPERVVFVLATTEPHKVPETIASRCQRFEFRNFTREQLIARLKQVVEAEQLDVTLAALNLIGRHAAGGMRDALALLDQAVSFQAGRIEEKHIAELLGVVPEEQLCQLLDSIAGQERLTAIALLQQMIGGGADPAQLAKDCISFLRELMLAKVGKAQAFSVGEEESWVERWPQLASLELERILVLIDVLARAVADMRWMSPTWLPLEMAVVRSTGGDWEAPTQAAAQTPANARLEGLIQRLEYLEVAVEKLRAGGKLAESPPGPVTDEMGTASGTGKKAGTSGLRGTDGDRDTLSPSESRQAEFHSLVSRWSEVSDALRQERQAPVEAFLREATPHGLDQEGRLLLVFARDREFHKVSLEHPNNKEVLERTLAQLMGRTVEVLCFFDDEIPPAQAESEESARELAKLDALATGSTPINDDLAAAQESAPAEEEALASDAFIDQGTRKPASQQETGETSGNPALEAALKIFGGTVVEVTDDSGEGSK